VVDLSSSRWEREVLRADQLVAVDFWHDKCPWCRRLDPIYRELAAEYAGKLKFARFNVLENEDNRHLAIHYGIMGTPTILFFCQGRPVGAIVGYRPKEVLRKELDEHLEKCVINYEQSTSMEEG